MTTALLPPVVTTRAASEPIDDRVDGAVAALREGRPVLLAGGPEGGSVLLAAALAEAPSVAWCVRHSGGFLTVGVEAGRADELDLPLLAASDPRRPRQTVAVDAAAGISTGISAADRARTARVLADPASSAHDLRRPGHVVPVVTAPGGVVELGRPAEAAVDLCRLAGLPAVGLAAALEPDAAPGRPVGAAEVHRLGARHGLAVVDLDDLVDHRLRRGNGLRDRLDRGCPVVLPTAHGRLRGVAYRDRVTGVEHLAVLADASPAATTTVAVHADCPHAVLGCPCGRRLAADLDALARAGGVVVRLRRAGGSSTGPCRPELDAVEAAVAAAVLRDLGVVDPGHGPGGR